MGSTHISQARTAVSAAPIFLVSWVRSGSTLLHYVLDTHRDIACPAELMLGPVAERLVQELGEAARARSGVEADLAQTLLAARGVLDELTDGVLARFGKPLWCDRSPINVQSLALLGQLWPEARFVCLYRDGLDVVRSTVELHPRHPIVELEPYLASTQGDLTAAAVDAWCDAVERMREHELRAPLRCHRVHYERLVQEPERVVRELIEWLGLAWDPSLLSRVFTEEHEEGEGDPKIRFTSRIEASSVGLGRKSALHLTPTRRARLSDALVGLGYPPATSPVADATSSPAAGEATALPTPHEIFTEVLPRRLRERAAELRGLEVSFRFVVTGAEPSVWLLDLTGPRPYLAAVDRPARCTATLEASLLGELVTGRVNAVAALYDGRIVLEGDEELAAVLRVLL